MGNVYENGCPATDSTKAFEARQAYPSTAATACNGNTVKNCEKQRAVCFWPFAFTDTKDVYVKASVKVDTTSTVGTVVAYNPTETTCSNGKRRSINENDRTINDGEEMTLEAYYTLAKGVQQLANQIEDAACDNTSVVITIVVLSAVLILSIILNSFMVFTKMRSGKE